VLELEPENSGILYKHCDKCMFAETNSFLKMKYHHRKLKYRRFGHMMGLITLWCNHAHIKINAVKGQELSHYLLHFTERVKGEEDHKHRMSRYLNQ
jgi:hypothetical protein